MLVKKRLSYSLIGMMGLCLLAIACGKKSKETPSLEPYRPHLNSQLEDFLSKQDVSCTAGQFCPEYMVKVLVFDSGISRVCTGFLTDSQTVATSATCLPSFLRLKEQDCSQDIFFFMPKTNSIEAVERRACSKVLKVSAINSDNPILRRDDLTFLSLDQPVYRRSLFPSRDGMPNKGHLTMWSIDQIDEHYSLIRRDICEVVHSTYFNPLATGEYSPVMTVASCQFKRGNSGSPLIDGMGLVRAIVNTTTNPKLIEYVNDSGLLTAPLKLIHHSTNFACAPTIYDSEVANENECFKELNFQAVDSARASMLSVDTIFSETLGSLKESLEKNNKFIRFSVSTTSTEEGFESTVITPKCFKDVLSWIGGLSGSRYIFKFSFPVRKFKKTMDAYARVRGQEIKGNDETYSFQFSPSYLRVNHTSNLYMWNTSVNEVYEDLTRCE